MHVEYFFEVVIVLLCQELDSGAFDVVLDHRRDVFRGETLGDVYFP